MKKQKKLLIFLSVCIVALLTSVILVAAYFSVLGNKDNKVTVGHNTIEISEDFSPPTEQITGENQYKKQVRVQNTGDVPCYIRVYADFSDSSVRANSAFSNDGTDFYSAKRDINSSTSYVYKLSVAAPGWTFEPDYAGNSLAGYYYYTIPVQPGDYTESLFSYVKTTNPDVTDIKQYDIIVYSESIDVIGDDGTPYEETSGKWRNAWTDFLSKSSDFANLSSISSSNVKTNTEVALNAAERGGQSPYSYSYYYKLSTDAAWTPIGAEWITADSAVFTPTVAGTYNIKISVKDNGGEIISKELNLSVS